MRGSGGAGAAAGSAVAASALVDVAPRLAFANRSFSLKSCFSIYSRNVIGSGFVPFGLVQA